MSPIETVAAHAEKLKQGDGPVQPGQPYKFSEASVVGDCCAQGDVYITLTNEAADSNFTKLDKVPSKLKLVPGPDDGAKHFLVLGPADRVEVYTPKQWSEESFVGPRIVVLSGTPQIVHEGAGHHGAVTLAAIDDKPTCYGVTYQQVFSVSEREARRARD